MTGWKRAIRGIALGWTCVVAVGCASNTYVVRLPNAMPGHQMGDVLDPVMLKACSPLTEEGRTRCVVTAAGVCDQMFDIADDDFEPGDEPAAGTGVCADACPAGLHSVRIEVVRGGVEATITCLADVAVDTDGF